MRHTHATLLLESGESVVYVAERLGDTVETVTDTYAHVTPRCGRERLSGLRPSYAATRCDQSVISEARRMDQNRTARIRKSGRPSGI